MSWSGLLAYPVSLMVVIQRALHMLTQMPCCIVSGHPTAFYLDNASDSVEDFHQYLRWYDFLGQLPIITDSQDHFRDPLTSSLVAIPETHPHGCLICVQWYRRQF